jgi:hypothetical protein
MLRHGLIGGIVLAAAASLLVAKPGVVKTRDGTTFQGDVTSDDTSVYITSKSGIQTKLDKRNVASIEDADSAAEQFGKQLSQLAPNDVDGRIKLARWAYDNRQYTDARAALDSALKIDPNNRAATELMDTIQRQVRLERDAGTGGAPAGATAATRPAPPATQGAAGAPGDAAPGGEAPAGAPPEGQRFLSPADINTIRQLEWNRSDANVRARLKGDVKRRFIEYSNASVREFNALNVVDQAWEILTKGTPEMRKDVEILTDPASLAEFRRPTVQGRILAGCATAGCHGTAGAGGFQLFTVGDNEAVAYTNFYILQKYAKTVDGRQQLMIDRAAPDTSLLVQYGLPAEVAEFDHPAVGAYRGIFRGRNDPTYNALVNWMGKTLEIVVPDYGIEYTPPTTRPATTAPAK